MATVATFNTTKKPLATGASLQGSGGSLQGGSVVPLQGSSATIQGSSPNLQGSTLDPNALRVVDAPAAPAAVALPSAADLAAAKAAAKLEALRGDIRGKQDPILAAYEALFGELDTLARTRAGDIETAAGANVGKLTEGYTGALPGIDSSYASVGAYDSTNRGDARDTAKKGYETSVEEVGKTKQSDLAKVGQYADEQKSNWNADKDSILRLIGRVGETENEQDLYNARNEVENKLGTLGATRSTLNTDAGARGKLTELTGDAGRFDAIKGSLDNIINSSMSGGVKSAAVQAVTQSAGLTDEDKQKVKAMYGDVYNGA